MSAQEPFPGAMQVYAEPNCGNAPRHEIVRRFAVALAVGDTQDLENLLAPGIEWKVPGEATVKERAAVLEHAKSAPTPTELRVLSVITHGREACIDGETLSAQGDRTSFCHVLRFASTSKTAAITKIRTYQDGSLRNQGME